MLEQLSYLLAPKGKMRLVYRFPVSNYYVVYYVYDCMGYLSRCSLEINFPGRMSLLEVILPTHLISVSVEHAALCL